MKCCPNASFHYQLIPIQGDDCIYSSSAYHHHLCLYVLTMSPQAGHANTKATAYMCSDSTLLVEHLDDKAWCLIWLGQLWVCLTSPNLHIYICPCSHILSSAAAGSHVPWLIWQVQQACSRHSTILVGTGEWQCVRSHLIRQSSELTRCSRGLGLEA